MLVQLAPDTRVAPTRQNTSADGESMQNAVITMSCGPTATPHNNIRIKKRLTTFALVLALMTGSVAQLAVMLYRAARIIAVSSLSFAADIASPEWREQERLREKKERIFKRFDKCGALQRTKSLSKPFQVSALSAHGNAHQLTSSNATSQVITVSGVSSCFGRGVIQKIKPEKCYVSHQDGVADGYRRSKR